MVITRAPYLKIEEVKDTAPVYNLKGEKITEIPLPKVFNTPVREDLIRKVFLALRTSRLQPKGTDPLAGKRTTAESWGVGYGVARVPRIKGSTRAAFVPMAVGGRRAHPPVTTKRIRERVNRKEKRLALMSAIAATAHRFYVEKRGHLIGDITLPIIVEDKLQSLKRTQEVREFLKTLGLWRDVERARKRRRIRAGKGKMRGRRYKIPKSVLIVVGKNEGIVEAARNLVGVDISTIDKLNVEALAPGGHAGRLTIWSLSAIEEMRRKFG